MMIGQPQSSFIPGHFYTGMVFLVPKDKPGTIACSSGNISAFIPFTMECLKNPLEATLVSYGRNVEFRVKQSQIGDLLAIEVFPLNVPLVKGLVVSAKSHGSDGYLLIERADIAKKVVAKMKLSQLDVDVGSCVEFIVVPSENRGVPNDGRERFDSALRVRKLSPGEVRIYEVSGEINGTIECLPPTNEAAENGSVAQASAKSTNESVFGFIKYLRKKTDVLSSVFKNSVIAGQLAQKTKPEDMEEKVICFHPESQSCKYSLLEGDAVTFKVRTDLRDRATEAVEVRLLPQESFARSKEHRAQGVVKAIENGFCYAKRCDTYNKEVSFPLDEVISNERPTVGSEVEFSIKKGKKEAAAHRVVLLPKGSITDDWVSQKILGVVVSVPNTNGTEVDYTDPEKSMGKIQLKEAADSFVYFKLKNFKTHHSKPMRWSDIKVGQMVEFLIPPQTNGIRKAVEVKVPASDLPWRERSNQERNLVGTSDVKQALGTRRGYITSVKETYGFIEVSDHTTTVFFHKSAYNPMDEVELRFRDEVVFELCETNDGGYRAENVYKLPGGSVAQVEVYAEKCTGKVSCPMRLIQPPNATEHDRVVGLREYEGVIDIPSVPNKLQVPYSMISLVDPRLVPKQKDQVECKLVHEVIDGKKLPLRAVEVVPTTDMKEAFVVSIIKGEYGFLDYKVSPTVKSIFFYNTEILNCTIADLKPGDLVSFYPHTNKKKKTLTAIRVTKIRAGSPSDRKNAAAAAAKEAEVEVVPTSNEPAVDDRPMRLRMGRRPTNSIDSKNGEKTNTATVPTNGTEGPTEVQQQLKTLPKNRVSVVREPEFPPDLNTKGFKFQRVADGVPTEPV